jgi:hypothetical protein
MADIKVLIDGLLLMLFRAAVRTVSFRPICSLEARNKKSEPLHFLFGTNVACLYHVKSFGYASISYPVYQECKLTLMNYY